MAKGRGDTIRLGGAFTTGGESNAPLVRGKPHRVESRIPDLIKWCAVEPRVAGWRPIQLPERGAGWLDLSANSAEKFARRREGALTSGATFIKYTPSFEKPTCPKALQAGLTEPVGAIFTSRIARGPLLTAGGALTHQATILSRQCKHFLRRRSLLGLRSRSGYPAVARRGRSVGRPAGRYATLLGVRNCTDRG